MMGIRRAALAVIMTGSAAAAPAAVLADTRVGFTSGLEYSSGDYGGTAETEIVSVPFVGRLTTGDWEFRASIPYRWITGPADIDEEGGAEGAPVARSDTESGFGDTTLLVTRRFDELIGTDTYVEATGRVRLPTGDEAKGLGSGATDYGLIGEVGYMGDSHGAYVSAGRRFLEDVGAGPPREDGWQAGLGGWFRLTEQARMGLSYNWREASRAGRDDPSELGAYLSHGLTDQLRISLSAAAGLSDASADYRTGVRLTWRGEFQRPGL